MTIIDLDDLTRLLHSFKEDEDEDKEGESPPPPYRN